MKSKLFLILLLIVVLVCCIGLCGCYNSDDDIVASAAVNSEDYYEYYVNLIREPLTAELLKEYEEDTTYTAYFYFDIPITLVNGALYHYDFDFTGLSTTGLSGAKFYYSADGDFILSSSFDSYFSIILYKDYDITDSNVASRLEVTYSGTTWTEGSTCTLNELSILINGGGSSTGSNPYIWYNYIIQVDRITLPFGSPTDFTANLSSAFNTSSFSYNINELDSNLYKSYSIEFINNSLSLGNSEVLARFDFDLLGTSSNLNPDLNFVFNPSTIVGSTSSSQMSYFFKGDYTWIGTGLNVPNNLSHVYGDDSFIYVTPCYFIDSTKGMFFNVSLNYPLSASNTLTYRITDNFSGLTFDSSISRPVTDVNSALIPMAYTIVESSTTSTPLYSSASYDNYNIGYNAGYQDGVKVGGATISKESYDRGYANGVRDGILQGAEEQPYTFISMLSAVIDAPIQVFKGLFTLDVLGVNMAGFFLGLMSCCAILAVLRMFLK